MRYALVRTACGCSMPGLARAADRGIQLAKAEAQGRKPGRRTPATTTLGRYVESKAPGLTRRLRKILKRHGQRMAGIVAEAYAAEFEKLRKDDTGRTEAALLIQSILDRLGLSDLGEDLQGELTTAMLAAFLRAAEVGATQVGMSAEAMTEQMSEAAHQWAATRGAELVEDLAGTTGDALRNLLARGIAEGMSVDKLQDALEGLAAFGAARAEMIARTELAVAHVQGNVAAWRESGEVDRKQWILADTHPEPDECDEAADAGVVGFDDEFIPGVAWPPAHPACLCDVVAVLREQPGEPAETEPDAEEATP